MRTFVKFVAEICFKKNWCLELLSTVLMTLTMVAFHGGDSVVFLKLLCTLQNWFQSSSPLSSDLPLRSKSLYCILIHIYLVKETAFDKQYCENSLDEKLLTFVNICYLLKCLHEILKWYLILIILSLSFYKNIKN